jgi:hypothetical protein
MNFLCSNRKMLAKPAFVPTDEYRARLPTLPKGQPISIATPGDPRPAGGDSRAPGGKYALPARIRRAQQVQTLLMYPVHQIGEGVVDARRCFRDLLV